MICCKMVWTTGDDSSAHTLCCCHSGGSMMVKIFREETDSRDEENRNRGGRDCFLGWQAFDSNGFKKRGKMRKGWMLRVKEEETAECTKSLGDSSDSLMSRQEGEKRWGEGGHRTWFGRLWTCGGWRLRWGSRGDCRLPGGLKEIQAAPLGEGGAGSSRHSPSTSSTSGRKKTVGVCFTSSVFPYPSLSHSLFVALSGDISALLRLLAGIWKKLERKKGKIN